MLCILQYIYSLEQKKKPVVPVQAPVLVLQTVSDQRAVSCDW